MSGALFWWLLVFFSGIGSCQKLAVVDFKLAPNSTIVKEMEVEESSNSSSSSLVVFSYILSIQTSSPISVFLSGSPESCSRIQMADGSGSIEIEIPDDTWMELMECAEKQGVVANIYVHLQSLENDATGRISLTSVTRSVLRTEVTQKSEDSNGFFVSDHTPYTRKIKLQSLADSVQIIVSSENTENALEVYITFCPTNKGILYTTSYAPKFDISLKSPKMEMYYDAYSCDSNVAFYSNSTQPTSPLIIRLESQYSINGTMIVLINGEEPTEAQKNVADYETGSFTLNGGEMKVVEMKYQPATNEIQAFLDVVMGSLLVYLSPCKNQEMDMFFGNLTYGHHRIDIDLERMMDNTTCSLAEIDHSTVFMFLKPSTTIPCTFTLWIPGQIATWHLVITMGLILLLLTACMILIIHFGRKKTGKLTINKLQK